MNVICLDGTTIECDSFRAIDGGVLVFTSENEATEEDAGERMAAGFVPYEELRYVLPEQAQPMSAAPQGQQQGTTPHSTGTGQWVQQPPQGVQQVAQGQQPGGSPKQHSGPR